MIRKELADKLLEKGKVFNLSNGLSFLRLIGAFYLYWVASQKQVEWAFVVTGILILTDFADGYFARKLNQISEMGKVLDPLADKFCGVLSMLALYQFYGLPLWLILLIIGRDLLILTGAMFLITRLPYVPPSEMPGKIAVTVVAGLFLVYLGGFEPLFVPFQILTVIALIVSLGHYIYIFYRKLSSGELAESSQP